VIALPRRRNRIKADLGQEVGEDADDEKIILEAQVSPLKVVRKRNRAVTMLTGDTSPHPSFGMSLRTREKK